MSRKRFVPWSFAKSLDRARKRIEGSAGRSIAEHVGDEREPVPLARRRAEVAAPALIDFVQAIVLGTPPEELEGSRNGIRIMAELAIRQLAAIGIKTGEVQEHDISDRFAGFIRAWFTEANDQRTVIDATAVPAVDESASLVEARR